MMQHPFQPGDRVRVIDARYASLLQEGATGTVEQVSPITGSVWVRYDHAPETVVGPTGFGRLGPIGFERPAPEPEPATRPEYAWERITAGEIQAGDRIATKRDLAAVRQVESTRAGERAVWLNFADYGRIRPQHSTRFWKLVRRVEA